MNEYTFLFTDVEGSTSYWERDPDTMRRLMRRHDELVGRAIRTHGGEVHLEKGEGDSFFGLFTSPRDAVDAAIGIQRTLADEPWPAGFQIRVRIGIHVGSADEDLRGTDVNKCARLRALGHGGQILLSGRAASETDQLPDAAGLVELGEYPLRGIPGSTRVLQVTHPALMRDFPALNSEAELPQKLPGGRRPSLAGRTEEIDALRMRVSEDAAAAQVVAITGPGGVGKSTLAWTVARACFGQRRIIWWIDASSRSSALLGLLELAEALGIETGEPQEAIEVLGHRLDEVSWLLVADGAPSPDDIMELLPPTPRGTLLVTSRHADWPSASTIVSLTGLPSSDSAIILKRGWADADEETLVRLAEQLGGHPLALLQAASYGRLTGMGPGEYQEMYQSRANELLERGGLPPDYPLSAAATISLSLEALPQPPDLSRLVLGTFAYFGDAPILREMLRVMSHPEEYGWPAGGPDELELLDAVATLRGQSLVEVRDAGSLLIHPVIRAVVQGHHTVEERLLFLHMGQNVLDAVLIHGEESTKIGLGHAALVEHGALVANEAAQARVNPRQSMQILQATGNFEMEVGNHASGIEMLRSVLDITPSEYGEQSREYAKALNNLGTAVQVEGHLDEAVRLLYEAIQITRDLPDASPIELAIQEGNLALVLGDLAQTETALRLVHSAMSRLPNDEAEHRAMTLAKRGVVLRSAGHHAESVGVLEEAERVLAHAGEVASRHRLFLIRQLALSYQADGKRDQSQSLLHQAISLSTSEFGEESATTAELRELLGEG